MAAVNLFIGGTGVNLAVFVKSFSDFYKFKEPPRVFALDTDAGQQLVAQRQLSTDLVLSVQGFLRRMQNSAERILSERPDAVWSTDSPRSFGDAILRPGASVVTNLLDVEGGLFTLRATGWLAFDDIRLNNRTFIDLIVGGLNAEQHGASRTPLLNVIASIAGGTGSGLFLPLVAAIRQKVDHPVEVDLHLVTPSAFSRNWQGEDQKTRRSRGLAGAYAAYRETMLLSSLSQDKFARPELRTVKELVYRDPAAQGPLFDRVFWWGRRAIDAEARAEDVFYEAGRFVTLINDANVYDSFKGFSGENNERRLAGVASIEYPRLERAQAIAAATVERLASEMAKSGDGSQRRKLIEEAKRGSVAFLDYVASQRPANMSLGSPTSAANKRASFDAVGRQILDRFLKLRPGSDSEPLHNGILLAARGDSLRSPNYAGSDEEWQEYVAALEASLRDEEQSTLQHARQYLDWLGEESVSAVGRTIEARINDTRTAVGIPSLPDLRAALVDLVEDLDVTRVFFERKFDESIQRDPALVSVESQRAQVQGLRDMLATRVTSSADFKRRPPRGFIFSPVLQGIGVAIGLGALLVLLLREVPLFGGIASGVVSFASRVFGRSLDPTLVLLGVAVLAFGVALLLYVNRERNFTERDGLRKEAEDELVNAWSELVVCEMLDAYWRGAVETCVQLAGSVPFDQVGKGRTASDGSVLAEVFTLIERGQGWLEDLEGVARNKRYGAQQGKPGWVHTVPLNFREPTRQEILKVLPRVSLKAKLSTPGGVSQITDIDVVRADVPGPSNNIPFKDWKPLRERRDAEERQFAALTEAFYLDLEAAVRPAIEREKLLVADLGAALAEDSVDSGKLASWLNDLAESAVGVRSVSADLTKPQPNVNVYVFYPPSAKGIFIEALRSARSNDALKHARFLPKEDGSDKRLIETRHSGEAIVMVLTATFDDESATDPVLLGDIEGESRKEYYGVGQLKSGDPTVTEQYSARNTEFHLVPELSTAANIETLTVSRPLAPQVVQRLYGSHQSVRAYPSMLELFYLARTKELIKPIEIKSGGERWTRWCIQTGGEAVPLVEWPTTGSNAEPTDPLLDTRNMVAVFDAFRICLTNKAAKIDKAPHLSWPPHAEIRVDDWATPEVAATIGAFRRDMHEAWQALLGPGGASARENTYTQMLKIVETDSAGMRRDIGNDWRTACQAVFVRGRGYLAVGALVATPV